MNRVRHHYSSQCSCQLCCANKYQETAVSPLVNQTARNSGMCHSNLLTRLWGRTWARSWNWGRGRSRAWGRGRSWSWAAAHAGAECCHTRSSTLTNPTRAGRVGVLTAWSWSRCGCRGWSWRGSGSRRGSWSRRRSGGGATATHAGAIGGHSRD
jgi:hypothetical protein